jgi:hypothetical protein
MGMRYPGVAAGLLQAGGPKLTTRTKPKGGVIEHNQLRIGAVIQHLRPLGISLSARASVDAQQLRNPPRRLLFLGALGGKWKRHPGGIRVVEARVFGADLSLRGLAHAPGGIGLPNFENCALHFPRRSTRQCPPTNRLALRRSDLSRTSHSHDTASRPRHKLRGIWVTFAEFPALRLRNSPDWRRASKLVGSSRFWAPSPAASPAVTRASEALPLR